MSRGRARQSLLRLVDANTNRALEGLRVCEDIVRFSWEMPRLFRQLRTVRHAIAKSVRQLPVPVEDLLRARESRVDIGRRSSASRIESLERLLVLNLQRAKESLRVLEECSRVLAPRQTAVFQQLRFRVYEVERDLLLRVAALRHH